MQKTLAEQWTPRLRELFPLDLPEQRPLYLLHQHNVPAGFGRFARHGYGGYTGPALSQRLKNHLRRMGQRVEQVKHFQQARFERTYADLLAQPAYAAVTRFFLDELYGPHDFTARDAQFARIVPALERLFAAEIIGTVGLLGELHALSERLDSRMAEAIEPGPLDAQAYAQAWRTVGEPALRNRQVDLSLQVGAALKRYTRNPLLRHTLRMMRAPAQPNWPPT